MSVYHRFPILYETKKRWSATVYINPDQTAYSLIEYGQIDGKLQECKREYLIGKNRGKKNETTPVQQCFLETERKWKDKREKENYREYEEEKEFKDISILPILPMLAQTYQIESKKRHDIQFPCFVQPKIDGLRCLIYLNEKREIVCQSRTGGFFHTVSHLSDQLQSILTNHNNHNDWVIDGELYTRNYPFEELAGLIKKKKLSENDKQRLLDIDYYIYDAYHRVETELPFRKRWEWIEKTFINIKNIKNINIVETQLVHSPLEFRHYFSLYVENGWEGIMLRNIDGVYRTNYRSPDLQKYKEFIEEEFEIVGYKQGDGRDKGTVIWLCKTRGGDEFCVRPRGTMEQRKMWYERGQEYVGKNLTVIFQEWSEHLIPRFPVGKAIRDGY